MDAGFAHGVWTLVLVVTFLAIAVWAYSRRRKDDFDAAARIPLEDDVVDDAVDDADGLRNHSAKRPC